MQNCRRERPVLRFAKLEREVSEAAVQRKVRLVSWHIRDRARQAVVSEGRRGVRLQRLIVTSLPLAQTC